MHALQKILNWRHSLFLATVATGGSFALLYLSNQFWHDEAYTLRHFAGAGIGTCLTDYHLPNNHIVFSVLLSLWMDFIGLLGTPMWCIRLLPWAFATGSVAATFAAVNRGWGPRAARWSAFLWGTSHVFASFACQVRGYSLSALLVALCLLFAVRWLLQPGSRDRFYYVVTAVFAVGVIPTNLLILGAMGLWVVLESAGREPRGSRLRTACAALPWLAGPGLGLLWYVWHPSVRADFFGHVPARAAGMGHVAAIFQELGGAALVDLWWLSPLFCLGAVVCAASARSRKGPLALRFFLIAALVPLLGAWRVPLYARNYFPLLPWWYALLGIAAGAGTAWLGHWRPKLRQLPTLLIPLLVVAACMREATFPEKFRKRFAGQKVDGLYYHYSQVDFCPCDAMAILSELNSSEPVAAFIDESDMVALDFCGVLLGFDTYYPINDARSRTVLKKCLARRWTAYVVATSLPNAHRVLDELADGRDRAGRLSLEADTGFFKLFRWHPAGPAPRDVGPGE